ncbi:patatin-like phospholipase family protein [Saccharopolyspora sp. K220]|uniref:patatin-like phospholipase family protein n=1 Tax=Saccharopolyspora soli TaxID=2926618 RepID=UPI001F5767B6|nr:patatin-like phospholipase family protein [Saccharopolyspora soli]MCI2415792.1 patatin-like phospholipase family protein [Saccharopolyspora soli]
MTGTLVLGGGGIAGIAWTTGLLAGMADAGLDVTGFDEIIGTSAGATVAAQLGSGLDLHALFARQTEPDLQAVEIAARVNLKTFATDIAAVLGEVDMHPLERRRSLGRFALDAETVAEKERRAVVESRLPSHAWPSLGPELKIVAVNANSGEPRVFEKGTGVGLVEAVAASCAVPGMWPPVTINGSRYVDGAVRSNTSADCAVGASKVLVVAPLGNTELFPVEKTLDEAIEDLCVSGARVALVTPDAVSTAAIGNNPADPSTRKPAAEAGRMQGRNLKIEWSGT